eukprot:5107004-Amphidinium_carterae.1
MLLQELMQGSYITQHPTSGYSKATKEIKRVYEGFKLYNYLDKVKPKVPQDEECNAWTALQQLLGLSLHYAPTFFSTITKQKMNDKRQAGWPEQQVVQHEMVLRDTKLLELYTVLPQKTLDMWITCGSLPASYMDNPTDNRHGYYNFHKEVQYAIIMAHYGLHQLVRLQLPRELCAERRTQCSSHSKTATSW